MNEYVVHFTDGMVDKIEADGYSISPDGSVLDFYKYTNSSDKTTKKNGTIVFARNVKWINEIEKE